ncbi:MAG: N-acetylmuramoyl-L-alanine amidase [Xanthomonadales bacterium]|jgi:N-acetylmuramoyl-L-alanine amidase|nr:N-acetylmuramoyl-L-alanine amidase [Xanthomonadales bacterium]
MPRLIINQNHLPYASLLETRNPRLVDLAVIHCTELPNLAMAREFGERIHYPASSTGNSGHYYIERSGNIEEWIPVDRVAHHVRGYNERSVGIELVNVGRYPDWFDSRKQELSEPYTAAQVESLASLLRRLRRELPALRWIAGHEALDTGRIAASDDADKTVFRKRDPGPLFPWADLLARVELQRFEPPRRDER